MYGIFVLLIIWACCVIMTAALLTASRRGSRILGISFSKDSGKLKEAQALLKSYRIKAVAAAVIFAAVSALALTKPAKGFADLFLAVLLVLFIAAQNVLWVSARKKLQALGGEAEAENRVEVDLTVSAEKGKGSVPAVIVWVFFALSFAPAAVSAAFEEYRSALYIAISVSAVLCQLIFTLIYYQMRRLPARLVSDDIETARIIARRTEKIQTAGAAVNAFLSLVFWIAVYIAAAFHYSAAFLFFPAFPVAIAVNAVVSSQLLNKLETEYSDRAKEARSSGTTVKFGCYYNPDDPRVFVPKTIESMGWTINLATKTGKIIFATIWIFVAAVIAVVACLSLMGFEVKTEGDTLIIDAPFYGESVSRGDITGIELTEDLPPAVRTNGYGGSEKSYGHFSVEGYGDCLLYAYNDVDEFIVISTGRKDAPCIFINDESADETEKLYAELCEWYENDKN